MLETMEIGFTADLSDAEEGLSRLGRSLSELLNQVRRTEGALGTLAKAVRIEVPDGRGTGERAALSLANGLIQGIGAVHEASVRVSRAISFGGSEEAERAGRQLSEGFAQGILSGTGRVSRAAQSVAAMAVSRMRTVLDIHSPSRVTREMGAYFAEGFAEGITETSFSAERSAKLLSERAAAEMRGSVPSMSAQRAGLTEDTASGIPVIHLTVPIEVDGIRLGEAAIRGINAVTRARGRLELKGL